MGPQRRPADPATVRFGSNRAFRHRGQGGRHSLPPCLFHLAYSVASLMLRRCLSNSSL